MTPLPTVAGGLTSGMQLQPAGATTVRATGPAERDRGPGSVQHGREDADADLEYAAGGEDSGPREPPYSGTPSGDARGG